MKKYFLFFLPLCSMTTAFAQNAHQIKLTLKPYKNEKIFLGYYYGKLKAIADSATLDANSTGTFQGKEKLPGGIYFIVSPRKEILFEVLIDKEQHFSILADTAFLNNVKFTGSADNALFVDYTQFMAKKGKAIGDAQSSLAKKTNKQDSAALIQQIKDLNGEVQQYRNNIEKKYPQSFLTTLLTALKEPVVPPASSQRPGSAYDSQFAYHYFKAHFWDGFSFTDDRMLRTPMFEPKLDRYFKDLVFPDPDSIIREVDRMLLESRTNKEMFKFLLVHFTQKYVNPEYMGQDAVFVHIFEKYINAGQADFFTEKYRKYVNDRAYSLMANLIGRPAAELTMTDTLEKAQSLYAVESRFTVVCFWDPTCSHCMEIVPKVDSIYQAKWKQEGVKIFGVMVDGGKPAWLKFIHDHNLKDWIHVYQTQAQQEAETASNRPGYRQLYDVYQTPILYLLDKDKHIIAKKLSYLQFDEVINLKLKSAKSN
ncbi:MAG: thioredoxin-like domain-containing protein [Chitinophagales bacterium]